MPEKRPSGPSGRPSDRVQSVTRAAQVLRVLSQSETSLSAAEIADVAGINRSIVHRLLRTLQEVDLVAETSRSRFRVGPWSLVLGHAFLDNLSLRRMALPYLVDLSSRFIRDRPWGVSLGMPLRHEAILIDRVWGERAPLNGLLDVGTRMSFDASANGRAMLATFPEADAIDRIGEERYAKVAERLTAVRERQFIEFASGEMRPGISAVAVAILGPEDRAVGSIAVSGIELEDQLHADSEMANHLSRIARILRGSVQDRV